ncbi:hypothetical protein PC113_g20323 [Phytophthora cactorum]|uniref:Uncharacterized protein n=1 Tax=Phytophthora cactorum TaxID=29920 RepID=A0A8T0YM69_9STRA|nr:hypothetical protein PC112_g20427 [Phytophthora cactorum]KAG2834784.1 hypothetical protein PC113_g20323 [Phytophthora cactorum]KAG2879674.1 hypothetical protein PC114_g22445 [Phytophthora cactorum]KAG3006046.1 hypothetical protein PC120_g17616 [Phytophthora cactorum]KAG3050921.1 hypothetical protein PC121_g18108 [Phytophthora cactorum]
MEVPRRQNRYTVKQRQEALERVAVEGYEQNYKGPGRESKITFGHDLVTFMKDVRREEEYLCTGGMIEYMKMEQGA